MSEGDHGTLADWAGKLRERRTELPDDLDIDPIERTAIDNSFGFAAEHARRYLLTAGQDDGWEGPRPILLLYTRGRRSGELRRNPLLYFDDDAAARHIVGSRGGSPGHPTWYLNILENPHVHVRVAAEFYGAVAETLNPASRAPVWHRLIARYPMFGEYQQQCDREIPLVRLHRA